MAYLDKPEVDALLRTPDRRTVQGARDHALLLFLCNTGARVDEAAHVTVADLTLGASPAVRLVGKGTKTRACPLWPLTADALKRLVLGRAPQDRMFLNRRGQPLTRFGIYQLVHRTVAQARWTIPSLHTKRVSPHTLRHDAESRIMLSWSMPRSPASARAGRGDD